jgi:ABC-2 type transport system ATP-binding protein
MEAAQDRRVGGYSKGMKQRIKVAAAIVHDPRILLLDEPFNGADPAHRLQLMALLRRMAGEGRTILFSSHILDEVERLAENVLVIVAGRLAASGDFREIRRLMTDRPHELVIRSSDNRSLAASLLAEPSVYGVEIDGERLTVRVSDLLAFSLLAPRVAKAAGVSLYEVSATDESLETVFSYLVRR